MGWKNISDNTAKKFGLQDMLEKAKGGKCPFCGKDVEMQDFRDAASVKEFRISGLCQGCQDDFFGE